MYTPTIMFFFIRFSSTKERIQVILLVTKQVMLPTSKILQLLYDEISLVQFYPFYKFQVHFRCENYYSLHIIPIIIMVNLF